MLKKEITKKTKISKNLKDVIVCQESDGDTRPLLFKSKFEQLIVKDSEMRAERGGLHASSIIAAEDDFCYREHVLSFFYKKNKVRLPAGLLRIFAAGESIHEKWQRLFVKHGLAEEKDIECRKHVEKFDLYMTPDAKIKVGDKKVIVEIKSMSTWQFQKVNTHPSGAKQCRFYLYFHQDFDYGIVLMEDKNNQDIKVQIIERDDEQVEPFIERLILIKRHKKVFEKDKKAPERKCKNADTKRAQGCCMREACFGIKREKLNKEAII
jgi:hypothetical protein